MTITLLYWFLFIAGPLKGRRQCLHLPKVASWTVKQHQQAEEMRLIESSVKSAAHCDEKRGDEDEDGDDLSSSPFERFHESLQSLGLHPSTERSIMEKVKKCGFQTCVELMHFARDFVDRPEVLSSLLQSDFGFTPLHAHQMRSALLKMIREDKHGQQLVKEVELEIPVSSQTSQTRSDADNNENSTPGKNESAEKDKKPLYKSVVVNTNAKHRKSQSNGASEYGLPSNYRDVYPLLAEELDEFYAFMTQPNPTSQDAPIRPATADVYMRHAKLLFGWYLKERFQHCSESDMKLKEVNGPAISLFSIIESSDRESAEVVLDFIVWLRSSRNISVSYEANLLRGLTKLMKFRFSKESQSDPNYGEKSYEDIALIRELRKLHRDANKKQSLSPRSSDEDMKWLKWTEYLQVIEALKNEVLDLITQYEHKSQGRKTRATRNKSNGMDENEHDITAKRKIASSYQRYLILAFFASVPDRQRTIRELELGRSFIKNKEGRWVIKHGPDDYKTGRTYGDRPPLVLPTELTPAIDDFLTHWRPSLQPTTNKLFVQPRTGNPLTQDSVYQVVSRSCFKHTGKRTNPHLLRDMLVTHVRESDASEKELEALALYMGHSITMQRTSYDRRTLTQKVAPAVELLQTVNKQNRQ